MARTWLAIRVELLGGRGEDLWPYPGRVLVVGPSHTFADLGRAIDNAFARWDRAHRCQFTLADATVVTDEESGDDVVRPPSGPLSPTPLVLDRAKVARHVGPADEFSYAFDFGDDWTHCCTVEPAKVDPLEVLGFVPKVPVASRGWGSIPDQYGRRWDADTGEGSVPRRPAKPHPMSWGAWPERGPGEPVDLRELRGATVRRDVPGILAAIEGREIDELLQHVGMALQVVLSLEREHGSAFAMSVIDRLELRAASGDGVLVEDLLAQLRRTPLAVRHLPVDLSELTYALAGDPMEPGGYLDLSSGDVVPDSLTDPGIVGEDASIDVEAEPDRWLRLDRTDSRGEWRDMAEFAARQPNSDVRRQLEAAIEGEGAFRRFRNALDEQDLVDQWRRFSEDRAIGRAREYLADQGIRVRFPG